MKRERESEQRVDELFLESKLVTCHSFACLPVIFLLYFLIFENGM